MNRQEQARPEQKFYSDAIKEAGELEKMHGRKANVIQQAYEAAVAELGYADRELVDPSKAKKVAKLMFSDKYLGNESFNPLLKENKSCEGFSEKGDVEKQRLYEHVLGMNLQSFVGNGGMIDRYGGLKRGTITEAVAMQFNSQAAQQLAALAWQSVYDPDNTVQENLANYAQALQEDPILAHTGKRIDAGRFESIDDAAQALTTSIMGRATREGFQYRYGVDFS